MAEEPNDWSPTGRSIEGQDRRAQTVAGRRAEERRGISADGVFGFYLVFGLLIALLLVVVFWIISR